MRAAIKLFSALPITEKQIKKTKPSDALLEATICRGFLFSPEIISNYSEQDLFDIIKVIEKEIGLTPEQMNSTFQKSWKKVRDAPRIQLVIEQLIHYMTTYGFERLGIYDEGSVYIPHHDLDIPELKEDIKLVIIKGYTKDELREKIIALLNTGIALANDTKKDVIDVAVFVDITEDDISKINNREVQSVLYDYFGLVPKNPIEFLRYLVFKTIGNTLLIKNKETFESIKTAAAGNINIVRAMRIYRDKYGLNKLSEIFYRFKPLFLAFRSNDNLRPVINKIRKMATIYHEPMELDYLNEITSMIKRGEYVDTETLLRELEKVSIFRKVRLVQALNYRRNVEATSIIYKVRNGKAYATEFKFEHNEQLEDIFGLVTNSIVDDIKKNVNGRRIFIPEYIRYTMPATEKQFTGYLPTGTSVKVDKNMIFGVHWENQSGSRIDLDLSLISANDVKIGWDGRYRNVGRTTLFSGDLTYAPLPNGASELFYINEADESYYILFLNYFNYQKEIPVPFKILIAKEQLSELKSNYMVDPNNILCVSNTKIDVRQKVIGLVVTTPTECTFYFNESILGKGITSSGTDFAKHARKYLFDYSSSSISLNEFLVKAGAILVDDKEEAEIDLSPESLEKDTIINLLY